MRRATATLVLRLLPTLAHAQVDTQRRVVDGGDWLLMQEPDIGTPWTGAVTASINHGRDVSKVVGGPFDGPLVQRVTTQQLDVSVLIGAWFRMGLALPSHSRVIFADRQQGRCWGDTSLWVAVPMTDPEKEGGLVGTWAVRVDLPTGPEELFLGDPGAVQSTFAVGGPLGPLQFAGNLGARFQAPVPLPGVVWGNALQWGLGLRYEPWGPFFVAAEGAGRTPVKFYAGQPQDYANEVVGLLGVRPSRLMSVSAGGGAGISQGLSSPELRMLAAVDVRLRTLPDQDADGFPDLRDVCPRQPEDVDGFSDRDGCPDLDNDRDGIADVHDDCPMVPENFNGVEDFDGCPDLATQLAVTVTTEGEEDVVSVTIGGDTVQAFSGETVERQIRELEIEVTATAARHRAVTQTVELSGRDTMSVALLLPAVPYGWLTVEARGPGGVAVDAVVAVEDVEVHGEVELPAGEVGVRVTAEGYLPADLRVAVPAGEHLLLPITLRPSGVQVEGDRIDLGQRVGFAVDEAHVSDDDPALLELLAWLSAHRRVELVRISGHADGTGCSRHNYGLSVRRAEAVRDWLVARGIDGARLQPVGTGEARATDGEASDVERRVGFLVLVWQEEVSAARR